MPAFAVWIEGRSCLILTRERRWLFLIHAKEERLGFFTMRVVEADDAEKAAQEALEDVRRDVMKLVRNAPSDPWEIRVKKIEDADQVTVPRSGYVWFPETE